MTRLFPSCVEIDADEVAQYRLLNEFRALVPSFGNSPDAIDEAGVLLATVIINTRIDRTTAERVARQIRGMADLVERLWQE